MKFLHIIKSPSYDSDGRLQKWLKQIKINNDYSDVLIVEDANVTYEKEINEAKISSKKLFFRNFFEKRKGYPFKILEYFFLVNKFISRSKFDAIIFHDVQQYLNLTYFLILNKNRKFKVIWDLHELPHDFLFRFILTRKWLKFILSNVDIVVYTNTHRRNYTLQKLNNLKEKSFFILNNYPEESYISAPKATLEKKLFKNNKPYILWLGMATKDRNFDVFFEVYKKNKEQFNLVILGKVDSEFKIEIDMLKLEGFIFNEFVKQNQLIKYIDNCYFSVVLYNSLIPNNFFCEPNRLYQLISRNIPIIVGNNPVMSEIIEKYNLGYVLSDDGRNIEELNEAVQKLKLNRDILTSNVKQINFISNFSWESQMQNILKNI